MKLRRWGGGGTGTGSDRVSQVRCPKHLAGFIEPMMAFKVLDPNLGFRTSERDQKGAEGFNCSGVFQIKFVAVKEKH